MIASEVFAIGHPNLLICLTTVPHNRRVQPLAPAEAHPAEEPNHSREASPCSPSPRKAPHLRDRRATTARPPGSSTCTPRCPSRTTAVPDPTVAATSSGSSSPSHDRCGRTPRGSPLGHAQRTTRSHRGRPPR
eukprot:40335-Pyramimonas_sp.AAC.2